MCKAKSKRKDLQAPNWLVTEWQQGNKGNTARILLEENFDKDKFIARLHIVITRKNSVDLVVEEAWCSRQEMADDLGRCHFEGGCSQLDQVKDPAEMPNVGSLRDFSKIENRAIAAGTSPKKASPVDPNTHKFTQAARCKLLAKENLVKMMDTIMAQISKLRTAKKFYEKLEEGRAKPKAAPKASQKSPEDTEKPRPAKKAKAAKPKK
eukprot:s1038_g9.t1